jgi:DNA-binding Lrp family transcriptional regulator
MKLSQKDQKSYDLDTADTQILEALSKGGMRTASQLAALLPIPRTTIAFRLNKLAERGFCSRLKKKNLSFWFINQEAFLNKASEHGEQISQYQGIAELHEVMNMLAKRPIRERVYVFEPGKQTEWFIKHIDENLYDEVSKNIKKNDIIVEALFSKRIGDLVPQISERSRGEMFGRATIGYAMDDTVLNLDRMILIVNDEVYLFDWEKITLTVVRNADVAETYRNFFEFYKSFGKKINFNELLDSKN